MGIMLGNQTPDQIARRLKIELTEEHKKQLLDAWQQKAEESHSGGTSTRAKCHELGIDDSSRDVEFYLWEDEEGKG